MNRFLVLAGLLGALLAGGHGPASGAPAAGAPPLRGVVLETHAAPPYTYLRLKTAGGETWAAVPAAQVKKGDTVTVEQPATMNNFESRTLKRSFDSIVFGTLAGSGPASSSAPVPDKPTAGAKGTTPAGATLARVPKAAGPDGRTVAEVVGGRAALNGKTVVVNAHVVKVNLAIMGRNWVHLRDGSGSAAEGNDDLLVTTLDKPAVGDVVSVRGTVRSDPDFGGGYRYGVVLEKAVLLK